MVKFPCLFYFFFILICSQNLKAQTSNPKWFAEAGASGIFFLQKKDKAFLQFPRLGMVRNASNGLSVGAGLSFSSNPIADKILNSIGLKDNSINFWNFDAFVRYEFKYSNNKWVPFAFAGYGLYFKDGISATVNFGGGLTHWLSPVIGVQLKNSYNLSGPFTNIESYIGMVYSLSNQIKYRNYRKRRSGF